MEEVHGNRTGSIYARALLYTTDIMGSGIFCRRKCNCTRRI